MSFAFGFSGDDIDEDSDGEMKDGPAAATSSFVPTEKAGHERQDSSPKRARREDINKLLSSLPSNISYNSFSITSPHKGNKAIIPRRALFDVKMQIMAESDDDETARKQDAGLGDSDIEQDVYEGGFKSWEGAFDLAQLLLDRRAGNDIDGLYQFENIIELGCGTAIPTLVLFQHALVKNVTLNLTLADYNDSVLRLVTLPNLLLIWALQNSPESFSPQPPLQDTLSAGFVIQDPDGDLEITPTLLEAFTSDLRARNISITLISGSWSPCQHFVSLLSLPSKTPLLILAAETIYSLTALHSFTSTLLAILKSVERGKALVAAKRMYFGVGGGVDDFKASVIDEGGMTVEVKDSGIIGCDSKLMKESGGVGRWLGEVQIR